MLVYVTRYDVSDAVYGRDGLNTRCSGLQLHMCTMHTHAVYYVINNIVNI